MDPIDDIISRIGTETPPNREELTEALRSLAAELRAAADNPGSTDIDALRVLRDSYTKAAEALAVVEEEEARRAEEVSALLAELDLELVDTLDGPDPQPDPDDPTDDSPDVEDAVEVAVVPVAATTGPLPLNEAVARLRAQRPRSPAIPRVTAEPRTTFRLYLGPENTPAPENSSFDVIADQFARSSTQTRAGRYRQARLETIRPEGYSLPGDTLGNTETIDRIVAPEAVAAAGGCCFIPTTVTPPLLARSTARPIRDSLPSFNVADSGAIQFLPPLCLPVTGVDVWTCADDAAVVPATDATLKQCDHIECAATVEVAVEAIYRCLTIGNFQHRFNRSRWTEALALVIVQQARLAETTLWTKMLAEVDTTHTAPATGSVYVNLLQVIGMAAADMRQQQRIDFDLHLWAPAWLRDAVNSDLIARRIAEPGTVTENVEARLRDYGVNVTWTLDTDAFAAQVDGPLTYPATANTILAPEGTFSFLDGGTLDLGTEIRDMDLNRQNNVGAFAETFEGLAARGCNTKRLNIPVEVCDLAPCPPYFEPAA